MKKLLILAMLLAGCHTAHAGMMLNEGTYHCDDKDGHMIRMSVVYAKSTRTKIEIKQEGKIEQVLSAVDTDQNMLLYKSDGGTLTYIQMPKHGVLFDSAMKPILIDCRKGK